MKVKILTLLILVTALFFGTVLWVSDQFVFNDRSTWAEMQLRTQVLSLTEAVQNEVRFLQTWVSTASPETLRRIQWKKFAPFHALASLQKLNSGWVIPDYYSEDKNSLGSAERQSLLQALNQSPAEISTTEPSIFSFVNEEKQNTVVDVIPAGDGKIWAFLHRGENLQSLLDSQKGSWSSVSMITRDGLTLAHSNPEYIGQKWTQTALLNEIQSTPEEQGSGTFSLAKNNAVFAFYKKIPEINAYIVAQIPVDEMLRGRSSLWTQLFLMALGLILIVVGVVWGLKSKEKIESFDVSGFSFGGPSVDKSAAPANSEKEKSTATTFEKTVSPSTLESAEPRRDLAWVQKEKMEASMKMAASLGHEIRAPLLAILGYAQRAANQTHEGGVKENLESLLREARVTKEIVEKLFSFAGEKNPEKSEAKIESALFRAMKNLESQFQQKGIRVIKNIQETPSLSLFVDGLQKAFENILQNSVEALERRPNKEIKISLVDLGPQIELKISDNGDGMEPLQLKKIFEPFFTTRGSTQHLGLGLSVALGILKDHLAHVDVKSERNKGTDVVIHFEKLIEEPKKGAPVTTSFSSATVTPGAVAPVPASASKEKVQETGLPSAAPAAASVTLPSAIPVAPVKSSLPVAKITTSGESLEKATVIGTQALAEAGPEKNPAIETPRSLPQAPPDLNVEELFEVNGVENKESSTVDEELQFLDDDTLNLAPAAPKPVPTLVSSPKRPAIERSSPLDQYEVKVRRPERKVQS